MLILLSFIKCHGYSSAILLVKCRVGRKKGTQDEKQDALQNVIRTFSDSYGVFGNSV